jgi:hypothetical protein
MWNQLSPIATVCVEAPERSHVRRAGVVVVVAVVVDDGVVEDVAADVEGAAVLGTHTSSPGRIIVASVASFSSSSAASVTPAPCAMANQVSPSSTSCTAAPLVEHVRGGAALAVEPTTTVVASAGSTAAHVMIMNLIRGTT